MMANKKIKILYCITKGTWGGAQKYVFDLATSLPSDLYDISVLTGNPGILTDKLQAAKIRTHTLDNLPKEIHLIKDFLAFFRIIKLFRKERPDIIHLNSSKMGFLGALAGRLTRVPKIIFTGHGWAFNEDRSKLQKKFIYFLHLLTVALAHRTIAVSEQTKNQIHNNNPYFNKILVVKNGVEKINFFDKVSAQEKILKNTAQGSTLANRVWLGTISELHKNKGLKYIIEAMHLLEVESEDKANLPILIIIGEGERREKLQQRINRYGLSDIIFMIGKISEAEKYLKAFDIFTLTSITEALPYAILEAGQAGLPIIASGVGGIPEIITDMENGVLVRPKEPEEIQKAINFFLNNSEKRAVFGQNLQKKIFTDFTREQMVKKTIAVYNS